MPGSDPRHPVHSRCLHATDLLEFEEPIAVLLKEIEALSMLPRTPERERSIDDAAQAAPTSIRGGALRRT